MRVFTKHAILIQAFFQFEWKMAVLRLRCMFSRLRGFGGNLKGFDENDQAFFKKQVHVLLLK